MTIRYLAIASFGTGLTALVGFMVGLADPAYYAPETTLDYAAATLNTLGPVAAAVALFIWWKVVQVRRGVFLILIAAGSGLGYGVGNFLGDIAGWEPGDDLFFYGSAAFFFASFTAGVVVLTVRSNWRWSGLFLLAVAAGVGVDSALVSAIGWLALGVVLWKGLLGQAET